jgi:hypothetical protein
VTVRGNLVGVATDIPGGEAGRQTASPICGAVSIFAIKTTIPEWEAIVFDAARNILYHRVGPGGRCS